MITNIAVVEEQDSETSFSEPGTSSQNQVAISANNNSVARVSWSSSSSSTSAEDDGKKLAEIRPQAFTDNAVKVVNTFTGNTGVNSTVNNTNIYKDGVTVNHNVYCCPSTSDLVSKCCWRRRRRIIIFLVAILGILLMIFLGIWIYNLIVLNRPNDTPTETMPSSTNIPLPSTSSTTSTSVSSTSTNSSISSTIEIPNDGWRIIERNMWGAKPPNFDPVPLDELPPPYVIFTETGTDKCVETQKCMEIVRDIQTADLEGFLGVDINSNFLIGGDGIVYEGRGWDVHSGVRDYDTEVFDYISIRVSFIGKFDVDVPTEIILQAAKSLLEFGVSNNKLKKGYRLKCLGQLSNTIENPGEKLYQIIETWEGWDNRTIEAFPPSEYFDF